MAIKKSELDKSSAALYMNAKVASREQVAQG